MILRHFIDSGPTKGQHKPTAKFQVNCQFFDISKTTNDHYFFHGSFSNLHFSDGSYYLSIQNAYVNCPVHVLTIMLMFNIVAIYKDWSLNKKIFETYRSNKTGKLTIDPLNEVPKDQLEKEKCSADNVIHILVFI